MNSPLLHSHILRWYKKNARPLPWRRTKNPYRILLSEIMAQQTQINRVVVFYSAWLKKFPTLSALAKAPKTMVLRQWSGLGYNNRALRLHSLAKNVEENCGGKLPHSIERLLQLPGVGKYTAHAVACLAFGADAAVVDVNVRRVYSRLFWKVRSSVDLKPEAKIWEVAENYLPHGKAAEWNQALMDIGANICTARNPHCAECPVSTMCTSAFSKVFKKKIISGKKNEPSFKGLPRRIYRGRILKALHDKPLTAQQLGMRVVDRFHRKDLGWVHSVLRKMEQDALISIQGTGERRTIRIAT